EMPYSTHIHVTSLHYKLSLHDALPIWRGQHALVDEGLTGKAWEVDGFPARTVLARALGAEFVLGTLAHHVGAPLQVHSRCPTEEQLPERRHGVAGQGAQRRVVDRHLTPAQDGQSLGLDALLHRVAGPGGVLA